MICKKIIYRNFRNIENAIIEPSSGVTVLNGDNGQGKTNMLEGIYIFARGKSFRTLHEDDLIRFGEDIAEIKLVYESYGVENELSIMLIRHGRKRIFKRNGNVISRNSEIIGLFNAVMFCPQQMSVITGGPGERRQFLNIAISQIDNSYLKSLQKYNRILEQRNSLIKSYIYGGKKPGFEETAEALTVQLCREWKYISEKRHEYAEKLGELANRFICEITSGNEEISISYPAGKSGEEYRRIFEEGFEREIKYGMTLFGAHREDMTISLSGNPIKDFGSQGQQRTALLSMKLAEGEIINLETNHYPVFLLDDILSELDEKRRAYLLKELCGKQVIITSCDRIETSGKLYKVSEGNAVLTE